MQTNIDNISSYSLLCKWFQTAVLPLDKELHAELLKAEDMRRCTVCGSAFTSSSNHAKYRPDCRKRITRKQAAERLFIQGYSIHDILLLLLEILIEALHNNFLCYCPQRDF